MANRTGTYFAFDGLGQANPTMSDFKYYATVQSWASGKHIEFKFVNSHEKAGAVRDTSLRSTLEASIRQRLAASKNMVVILSDDTRKSGSMLTYEIEKAVDTYNIPLIIAHTGYNWILDPAALHSRWPNGNYPPPCHAPQCLNP
ncbi:TIR domain-containing protein [Hoeflea sp. Naph1]|uniref:TIR domain-containing protein n=1 Tax=Hoeflea sp. Naph1 TaxID=3388653 RepID=UPI00398F913A